MTENTSMQTLNMPIKFDESEIAEVNKIRDGYAEAQMRFGNLYIQKRQLDETERVLNEGYVAIQKAEKEFLDKVVVKYGEGSLDPATGIFTPAPKKA